MPEIPVQNCCGCTACYSICPKSAIAMKTDQEGFFYPQVNVEKCVNCGLCDTVCPLLHPPLASGQFMASVITQSTKLEVLQESTSGGFLDALCETVISCCQGYVAGVAYDKQFMPSHEIVNTYKQAQKFRNSKYAQSYLGDTFEKILALLQQGETVVFIGTPCQVAGLKGFLQKDYELLITADLVCRSVPSPKLWRKYLDWQEKRYKGKIRKVTCRKKTYGYHSGALEIDFENGHHYAGSNRVDYFMKAFHADICSRPSCYVCQFKTKHRCSDFTVFDAWEAQAVAYEDIRENDRGYSNVLVHSQRGLKLMEFLQNVKIVRADAEKMFVYTGGMESKSITMKPVREQFYQDLDQLGFERTVKKYVRVTVKDRLIEAGKPLRYRVTHIWRK